MMHDTSNAASVFLKACAIVFSLGWATVPQLSRADQVIADDLIVQSSICVGLDCVDNENFGFDTIRLKENNTRIGFDDTSTSAGFPANDWQLTANDSASGGANKFSIDDITGGKTPFTIIAGAPTSSLFIASTGKIGLRTATPVLDVHVNTSDTPAFRLEQNAAGGFSAQTWDVAGNEANFFIRDVTGGSRLPFRIRPGAPTSSIDISASGNVGLGTTSPTGKLTINSGSSDTTMHLIQTGTVAKSWEVKNNAATGRLTFGITGTAVVPFKVAPAAVDNLLRVGVLASNTVDINGNLVVTGTITPDYVFTPAYKLESIKEHATYMWREKHLPAVGAGQVNDKGEALIDVGARSQGILEELEKAHIYIEQLHDAINQLTVDKQQLASDMHRLKEDFETRLTRLETGRQADVDVR